MTKTVANRDVAAYARHTPDYEIQGYGAVSYTPRGYWAGHLPRAVTERFHEAVRKGPVPTIYSYGTPIAWFERGVWVVPAVRYSVTTGKHQGQLWKLPTVSIPGDCSPQLLTRIIEGLDVYDRWADKLTSPHATDPRFQ